MIRIRILLLAILACTPAPACMNVDGTTIDGGTAPGSGFFPANYVSRAMDTSPDERFQQLTRKRDTKNDDAYTARELEGVGDVFHGNYDQAIAIFEEIEADKPGRYGTAANLGTAYELQGNLDLALKWIAEGIRRNPESHGGTEWLHLAIIKARMGLKTDPDFLRKNHIITLPERPSQATSILVDGQRHSAFDVSTALQYQLTERAVFVKPPDPVVADLLFTFGVLEGHLRVVEAGIRLLDLSREYGYPNPAHLDQALHEFRTAILIRKVRLYSMVFLVVAAFVVFLVYAYRRKWFFLSSKAYREHQQKQSAFGRFHH